MWTIYLTHNGSHPTIHSIYLFIIITSYQQYMYIGQILSVLFILGADDNESTDVLMPRWQRKKNSADHMIMINRRVCNAARE